MAVRLGFLALFVLGGFVYWPIFFLAALSAYALISDLSASKAPEPDEWFARRWTTTAADPRWRSDFLQFCQSPAETAFLDAMIDAYDLEPHNGILQGGGLTLDLQVKMSSYRADFVASGWLVVEIDGAAWHSSDAAVTSDRQRDDFMRGQGYRVLRIPAKLVFQSPSEAVAKVRTAFAQGRPTADRQSTREQRPKSALKSAAAFLQEINDGVERQRVVQDAMKVPELVFQSEKVALDSAMASAENTLQVEDYIGDEAWKRESYDRFNEELRSRLAQHGMPPSRQALVVPPLVAPPGHEVDAIDRAMKHAFGILLENREKYFSTQRARIRDDPRLRPLVQANLAKLGCPEVWEVIAFG